MLLEWIIIYSSYLYCSLLCNQKGGGGPVKTHSLQVQALDEQGGDSQWANQPTEERQISLLLGAADREQVVDLCGKGQIP